MVAPSGTQDKVALLSIDSKYSAPATLPFIRKKQQLRRRLEMSFMFTLNKSSLLLLVIIILNDFESVRSQLSALTGRTHFFREDSILVSNRLASYFVSPGNHEGSS